MSELLKLAQVADLGLKNRVVMSPMCMYEVAKEDELPPTFILPIIGGGVSLIITESTAVLPDGRITKNDLGLLDNPGLCEYLVQTKQVDLILQARALLRNPNWVMKAATALRDYDYQAYNASYERARL